MVFGPSASISCIFNILKKQFPSYEIDFIGQGHTLDLQSNLPYNNIYRYKNEKQFKELISDYNYFITALDFEKAKFAKECNVKTIVYDTLLWYWKDKSFVKYADYYITQKFYGVKDILNELKVNNSFVISPLIQKKERHPSSTEFLLINFGGLENTFWSLDITVTYVRNILSILLPVAQQKFKHIKIVCSQNHLTYLKDLNVSTVSYQEMQFLLQQASYVIATPGLGNIYEIANYQVPSLFLPPVNDSQGQQLKILKKEGLIDNDLDNLENFIHQFNFDKFSIVSQEKIQKQGNMSLKKLFKEFGLNGKVELEQILKAILEN